MNQENQFCCNLYEISLYFAVMMEYLLMGTTNGSREFCSGRLTADLRFHI